MGPLEELEQARHAGRALAAGGMRQIRERTRRRLRRSIGVTQDPPPPCDDPAEAFFAPGSVIRELHGDLPSMLIGGLASLLLQMLHPLAMAGVADHSRYREDPLGRLERTARFVGVTTYGSRSEAEAAIRSVRRIHERVTGFDPEGRPYAANDPALLAWVHATEVTCFLAASAAYGPRRWSAGEQDRYLDEMARVAVGLGVEDPPRTLKALEASLDAVRPELRLTDQARTARNFVILGSRRWPHEIAAYSLLVAAAQGVLPPWARRELGLVSVPASDRFAVRPAASALCGALRWMAPAAQVAIVSPPSTAIT